MPTGAFQRDQRHESLILPEFSPLFVCCIPPSIHPLFLSLKHHSCHHFLQSSISYDDQGKMIIIIPTTVIKNRVLLTTTLSPDHPSTFLSKADATRLWLDGVFFFFCDREMGW
ncbi:hypothetical protein CDAR_12051 [Caerostris darwini]|uniref:Uncharacterized protein n=1 Tax=Caerostris darwini TaxID=1538125 RepID=A0AAV4M570_9ARAC|nr:hypothetical protein CDAR_12051 [Caerostris darwini]